MTTGTPLRVLVAGGGVAAAEFLLAVRALAGRLLELQVLSPQPELVFRPWMVAEPFGLATVRRFDLAEIVDEHGASLVRGTLAAVDPARRRVRSGEGREYSYDVLVVATGARTEEAIRGAVRFGGADEDIEAVREVLERAEAGESNALTFATPGGLAWTLPIYELAFLTRSYLDGRGREDVAISLVTPEDAPLAAFGRRVSETVSSLASDWRIALYTNRYPVSHRAGQLRTRPGPSLPTDEVVALPHLRGPAVRGLPSDEDGFLLTDPHGSVRGVENVYAAGDVTAFPVKQGGIAAQQADAAAEAVAALAGAAVEPQPFRPVLRGLLLTGSTPIFLTNEVSSGQGDTSTATGEPQWWPPTKIAGRYLAPYLAIKAAAEPPDLPLRRLEIDDLGPFLRAE